MISVFLFLIFLLSFSSSYYSRTHPLSSFRFLLLAVPLKTFSSFPSFASSFLCIPPITSSSSIFYPLYLHLSSLLARPPSYSACSFHTHPSPPPLYLPCVRTRSMSHSEHLLSERDAGMRTASCA